MDKRIGVIVLTAAVLAALALFLSPHWSAAGLARAAATGNVDVLSNYVDFPSLRDDIKGQAVIAMSSQIKKSKHKNRATIAAAFGTLIMNNVVDSLVTPQTVSMAVSKAISAQNVSQLDITFALLASSRTEWIDANTFRLNISNDSSLTWHREGFSWRLTRLTLNSFS